ncbi:MAG: iron-sulfur cluster assembly scaffold protein [Chloroflexota bacterium]
MNRQDYIDRFLEHYESPRHYGPLARAKVIVKGHNPACGDEVTIYLKVGKGEIAEQVQFEGKGCAISQAGASMLLEMVQGKTLAEIEAISYNDLLEALGKTIVLTRVRCATLGLTTLKKAIQQYLAHQNKTEQQTGRRAG